MRSATWLVLAAMVGLGATVSAGEKARSNNDGAQTGGAADRHANRSDESRARPVERAKSGSSDSGVSSHTPSEKRGVTPTAAQLRHPRAGTGRGDRDRDREWRYGYHGYRPYNRYRYGYWDADAYWAPYYYGYGYGYGYGSTYPRYSRGYYREAGALRLRVEPERTRVFVDGYYAGVVDDFDGIFQRLYLAPGRHEITLRLDGHRSHRFRVYVPVDQTLKLHHRMVAGEGEDHADFGGEFDDEPVARPRTPRAGERAATPSVEREPWGTMRLDVQPGDASVYVDGEFRGTVRDVRSLRLPAGVHKVEIVRPGFRTVERDLTVEPDEAAEIVAELEKN